MLRRTILVVVIVLIAGRMANAAEKKQLLLVGQKRDNHPVTTHEFMPGLRILAATLEKRDDVEVRVVQADGAWPEGPELIRRADGLVLYVSEGARWIAADPRRQDAIAQLAARGGGLTALHWAIGSKDPQYIAAFATLFGGCHGGPDRKYQVLETRLQPAEPRHPMARGLAPLTIHDEFYYRLKRPQGAAQPQPVLTATIDGAEEMVALAFERPDGGRSFGFTGLHFHENWKQEVYRRLVTQGVLWTLKIDIPAQGVNVDVPPSLFVLPTE
ncbi:MAG TPA: ThuA domain-containing protein [Pirellulales bacterium]|nr:ThuA domain-containing protein [Pirellulales bacterium]